MALSQKQIEERLLSSIKSPEHLNEIILEGISKDYFVNLCDVFSFFQKYHSKYGVIPSSSIIKANYPEFVDSNNVSDDERHYLIGELVKSDIQRKAIKILNRGAELVTQDIYGGIDYILSKLGQIRKVDERYSLSLTDKDALKRFDELKERKEKIAHGGKIGIRTGFSLFDDNNIGWQPGDFIGIIGRMKVGKSWLLQYTGCSAYLDGYKVVFLSPEMAKLEVESRWDTMMGALYGYKFPNEELKLGKADEEKYKEFLTQMSKENRWHTFYSSHNKPFTISSIEAIIEEFTPDLLCIDGFMMIRNNDSRFEKNWEALNDLAYSLKSLAQNNKVVILVTAQARRMSQDDKDQFLGMPGLEHIYGGDSLGQACDIIITLADTDKEENTRYISIPARRGGVGHTKRIKLKFDVNVGMIGC